MHYISAIVTYNVVLTDYHEHMFNGMGWKMFGTALRTLRLTSLAHLPDSKYSKYGLKWANKWPKKAENSLLATQINLEGLF